MYKRELKSFFLSLKFIDKQPFMGRYKWVVTGTANNNPCWEEAVATDCIKMTKMETTILKLKLVTKKSPFKQCLIWPEYVPIEIWLKNKNEREYGLNQLWSNWRKKKKKGLDQSCNYPCNFSYFLQHKLVGLQSQKLHSLRKMLYYINQTVFFTNGKLIQSAIYISIYGHNYLYSSWQYFFSFSFLFFFSTKEKNLENMFLEHTHIWKEIKNTITVCMYVCILVYTFQKKIYQLIAMDCVGFKELNKKENQKNEEP